MKTKHNGTVITFYRIYCIWMKAICFFHDDVIIWKHFPRYWPFVWGIHRSPVNSPHKGHWRGALMFTLICARINGWVNNREAGDLRRHRAHYDVIVMCGHYWDYYPGTLSLRQVIAGHLKLSGLQISCREFAPLAEEQDCSIVITYPCQDYN